VGGQENAAPTAVSSRGTKALADAAAAITKPAPTRFGFRAPPAAAPVPAAAAPAVSIPAPVQDAKRRKTIDEQAAQPAQSFASPIRSAAAAGSAALLSTPSAFASAAASVIPSVTVAAPAELISSLFHTEMMDDVLAGECRTALAGKVTASKFDYKERIGQLDAQLKVLRKVVSTLTKKAETFLEQAVRIEAGLHEEVAQAKNRARDLALERATLADKAQRALQLVKQLQAQRDNLMNDSKATAAQVAQHAAVMDAAQQLQSDTDAKLTQCTKDLQETMAALDQTTMEREQSKQLIVEMQAQLDTAAAQMHTLEEDKAALQITCDEQTQTISERDAQIAQLETSMTSTREQYVALMSQWSTLQSAHEKSEAHSVVLDKTIASLRLELEESQKSLLTAQAEMAAQVVQSADARSKAATELSSMRGALNGEVSALRRQMDEALARNDEESLMLKGQIEQLSSAKTSLQESAQRAAVEMASLRGQLLSSAERVGSLEVEGRRLEAELSLARLQLNQKSDEVFATVAGFERIQKFHEERAAILQAEKDTLEKTRAELSAKIAQQDSEKKSLQTQLDQTGSSLAERTTELTTLRAEHASLLSKSAEERSKWEASQAELQASLASLTSTTAAQISSLEAQVAGLTARSDSESARATQLARELASFKALSGVSSESQMENLVKLSLEAETLRSAVQDKGKLAQELIDTKNALAAAQRKMAESEATRRALHNTIQELKGNIRVFTRVRPMFHAGAKNDVNTGEQQGASSEDAVSAVDVSADGRKVRLDLGQGGAKQSYAFDACFGPSTTQQQLFDEVSPFIQSALDGCQLHTTTKSTHTVRIGASM
jgi:kinesin family protein C1